MRWTEKEDNCSSFWQALIAAMIIALILPISSHAIEIGDGLDLGGNVRWRAELDGKDFSDKTAMNELSFLRSRVGLTITAIENTTLYLQMQDSRNLGVNSSGLTNDTNLGIHQAYIELSNIITEGLSLQIGRFETVYGRHRLMGNVGWDNVGRSFDGGRLMRKGNTYSADIFCLKVLERSFDAPPNHKDWKIYGLHTTFLQDRLDLYILYDWDQMKTGDDYDLARFTIGSYFKNKLESGIGYEFDAAIQTGYQGAEDISAYMIAGDLYYSPKHKMMFIYSEVSKIGIGFDITSGDDDITDDEIKSFNNLYYTGHKFRGYMDFFLGTSTQGLMDLILLRAAVKPRPHCQISVDIHHFRTMEDHLTPDGDSSKAIGQEIDITFKRKLQKGLAIQGGISTFIASDDWIADADPAYWFYAMITAGF
jgi:hypothetical protein